MSLTLNFITKAFLVACVPPAVSHVPIPPHAPPPAERTHSSVGAYRQLYFSFPRFLLILLQLGPGAFEHFVRIRHSAATSPSRLPHPAGGHLRAGGAALRAALPEAAPLPSQRPPGRAQHRSPHPGTTHRPSRCPGQAAAAAAAPGAPALAAPGAAASGARPRRRRAPCWAAPAVTRRGGSAAAATAPA